MRKYMVIISFFIILIISFSVFGMDLEECKNLPPDGIPPEFFEWYSGIIASLDSAHAMNLEQAEDLQQRLDLYEQLSSEYGPELSEQLQADIGDCINKFKGITAVRIKYLQRRREKEEDATATETISPEETLPEIEIQDSENNTGVSETAVLDDSSIREPIPPDDDAADVAIEEADPVEAADEVGVDIDDDDEVPDFYLDGGEDYTITESNYRTIEEVPTLEQQQVSMIDPQTFNYINEKIMEMKTRNDSLRDIIQEQNERILKEAVNVYDSMQIYQNKIDELTQKLHVFTRDSIQKDRRIEAYEDSISTYRNRAQSLNQENDSLWNNISDNLDMIVNLNSRIDSLEMVVSLLDRELMFKENKLNKITPYASAESFVRLALRTNSRVENEDYVEEGSINFGGLGLHLRKSNIFGQRSFRAVELRSEFNTFETKTKADFYAGGGIWMYPWMLPWLPYAIPGAESVVDSTDFFVGMNYYYKSGIDYYDVDNKEAVAFKFGLESYIHYINTELRWMTSAFDQSYGYNVSTFGIQHRILKRPKPDFVEPEKFRPSSRFARHGNKKETIKRSEEQKDEPKKDSNILFTFEFFGSYLQNSDLATPYDENYDSFLLFTPEKSKKTYIGAGLTWGGNAFSFMPNLHNRLAENGRFDIMPVYPVHMDNIQMFGLYTYGNIDKEGKFSDFVFDAFYHLPSIPVFQTPMIFRLGFYQNATGRWLTTSMTHLEPNSWEFDPSDSLNPITYTNDIVPRKYFEIELWILFETMPLGITAAIPEPIDEFPIEISVETFFNLR